ncbi:hypothetical protein FQN60_009763 [Etheostoma spectabile]|uniref:Uncharacterized protein n=1 Tax=Etheostoma spectabile TaxID=54343 RepID=A0A5J5DJS5_9PERO|nr:hypothetical protein FQN60_009763 [Etheostoma spectabile]
MCAKLGIARSLYAPYTHKPWLVEGSMAPFKGFEKVVRGHQALGRLYKAHHNQRGSKCIGWK